MIKLLQRRMRELENEIQLLNIKKHDLELAQENNKQVNFKQEINVVKREIKSMSSTLSINIMWYEMMTGTSKKSH